ncbi:MAG: PA14 domain-containing protein [Bacteroidota bacterium]
MNIRYLLYALFSLCSVQLTSQDCVGTQGQVKWYYWTDIDGNDVQNLYSDHDFPQSPEGFEIITELASPENYDEDLGGVVKGFIKVDQTNTYTFNLTSSADGMFFLSTTMMQSDTAKLCEVTGWTGKTEHDKYPEQTSGPVSLTAGNYYYFELHQKDDRNSDYVKVYWKTSPTDNSWSIVPNTSLYNYDCFDTCPQKGTPCDDEDANTINDEEDGACNCLGVPANANECVGSKGKIRAYYWDNVLGNDVEDLHEDPRYPMNPDRMEVLNKFEGPLADNRENFGSRIQAMVIAPETGDYLFNVTGDDRTWLYLSDNEEFERATVIAEVPGWTRPSEFDKYTSQTSEVVSLNKGQLYYIEINHKQGTGGDNFAVSWKTPSSNETWKRIDGVYLFSYACEVACLSAGTACDDDDSTTENDVFDADCNCAGTPCPNGDCGDGMGYNPDTPSYEECSPTDDHNDQEKDSWLSCEPKENPNPARGITHWIQYDFNEVVNLSETRIWNYNVENETGSGFSRVAIDYSLDGENWLELGEFNWYEAPGISNYEGFEGPNFGGVQAQYVLITALNSFDGSACMGFSQIQFETSGCALAGDICSSGGESISVYDLKCDCRSLEVPWNDCGSLHLELNNTPLNTNNYSAQKTIESAAFVGSGSTVNMVAGESIILLPGFTAKNGSDFLAKIISCEAQPDTGGDDSMIANNPEDALENRSVEFKDQSKLDLVIYPTPTSSWTTINFNLPTNERVNLSIFDNAGKLLFQLANNQSYESGNYYKAFPAQRLAGGVYYVTLQTASSVLTKSMVVVENLQ